MRSTGKSLLAPGSVVESVAGTVKYRAPAVDYSGPPIGILLLDTTINTPFPPRTPVTASAFEVPLRWRVVEGCTQDRLIYNEDDALEEPMVMAARKLVDDGARAITSNCGFMLRHQAAVSDAVDVPVLLSSLMFAPFLLAFMGSNRKLGILTASGAALDDSLLRQAGVSDPGRVVVGDLENQPSFREAVLDRTGDYDRVAIEKEIEKETVGVAASLIKENPEITALLFECTVLPPFSRAVARSVGVPVFDAISLIDVFVTGLAPDNEGRFLLDGLGISYLGANWMGTATP